MPKTTAVRNANDDRAASVFSLILISIVASWRLAKLAGSLTEVPL
jgi:hypothetical protein